MHWKVKEEEEEVGIQFLSNPLRLLFSLSTLTPTGLLRVVLSHRRSLSVSEPVEEEEEEEWTLKNASRRRHSPWMEDAVGFPFHSIISRIKYHIKRTTHVKWTSIVLP